MTAYRDFVLNVTAPSANVPGWYNALTPLQWNVVPMAAAASNRGATAESVFQASPGWSNAALLSQGIAYPSVMSLSSADTCQDWTGACVDDSRGDLLFVAHGGHSGSPFNNAYGLRIRSDNPGWYRINEATPGSVGTTPWALYTGYAPTYSQTTGDLPANGGWELGPPSSTPRWAGQYRDGRSRAMHTGGSEWYYNGYVWFPFQCSPQAPNGSNSFYAWKFNRSHVNTTGGQQMPAGPADGTIPQPWEANAGPWTKLGNVTGTPGGKLSDNPKISGQSAMDPVTKIIFCANGDASNGLQNMMWLKTATGTPGYTAMTNANVTIPFWSASALCVIYDAADTYRYLVMFNGQGNNTLHLCNLKATGLADGSNMSQLNNVANWSTCTLSDPSVLSYPIMMAHWHPGSQSLFIGAPYYSRKKVWRLQQQIPVVAGGSWTVTEYGNNSAVDPAADAPYAGVGLTWEGYTRFNLMNMSGTASGPWALVYVQTVNSPTYIMPIP